MADFVGAIPGLAGAGASGLLLLLVMYLVKSNRDDRTQHRELVSALTAEHRQEVAGLDSKIARLEGRLDELQRGIDTERDLRRLAQDQAASAQTRAAAAEAEAAALRQVMGTAHDPAISRLTPPPGVVDTSRAPDPADEAWWRTGGDSDAPRG